MTSVQVVYRDAGVSIAQSRKTSFTRKMQMVQKSKYEGFNRPIAKNLFHTPASRNPPGRLDESPICERLQTGSQYNTLFAPDSTPFSPACAREAVREALLDAHTAEPLALFPYALSIGDTF